MTTIFGAVRFARMKRLVMATILAPAIVLTLGIATTVSAQTVGKSKPQTATKKSKTEQFRQPTPEEAKVLAEGMRKSGIKNPEDLKVFYNVETGAVFVVLTDDYMDFAVVQKNPDGTLTMGCITGLKAASEAVEAAAKKGAEPIVKNPTTQLEEK